MNRSSLKPTSAELQMVRQFLTPLGSPTLCRSLAYRRSFLRNQILVQYSAQQVTDEPLDFMVTHLSEISPTACHDILSSPEMWAFIQARLYGYRQTSADIAILGRLAVTMEYNDGPTVINVPGKLSFHRQPIGPWILTDTGGYIDGIKFIISTDTIRIEGQRRDEGLFFRERPRRDPSEIDHDETRTPIGDGAWELVDGWPCFANDFNDGNVSIQLGTEERRELVTELRRSMQLVRTACPDMAAEMSITARYISPIKPGKSSANIPSFSSRDKPGVIFIGTHHSDGRPIDWKHLAESCFHEHLHNRLYLLEEAFPLTCPANPPLLYYSPWKGTERPIDGMLHAIYIFSHLSWFWSCIGSIAEGDLAIYAREQEQNHIEALQDSLLAVMGSQELTDVGKQVIEASAELVAAFNHP